MSLLEILIASGVMVGVAGFAGWILRTLVRANDDLRHFVDFEGLHFEE